MKKEKNRLVVGSRAWADSLPEWLLDEIRAERLIYGMGSLINPDCPKIGDAEVCAYLFTAGLVQPLDSEQANIYIYLTAKLIDRKGRDLDPDFKEALERGLNSDEERELEQLKSMIYSKRGGEIDAPMLNMMRAFKSVVDKEMSDPQKKLISF